MIICGLKLTHDGAIALIDNGRLAFSYEVEKLNNNDRYTALKDVYSDNLLRSILAENGYRLEDVDQFVIDGWGDDQSERSISEGTWHPFEVCLKKNEQEQLVIPLNRYGWLLQKDEDILSRTSFVHNKFDFSYHSYMHVSGHIMSAYCTSPFAQRKEDAFILVWDGGMVPQLFYFNVKSKSIENLGVLFHLLGYCYSIFPTNYSPFNRCDIEDLSIAGKVMAYIALGKCDRKAVEEFKKILASHEEAIQDNDTLTPQAKREMASSLVKEFVIYGELHDVNHDDMMTTFHVFLEEVILEYLSKCIDRYPQFAKNLCFSGGSALNIKWNSHIRASGLFKEVWVPPIPNDSGSAIGVACCEMFNRTGQLALDWQVYSGPVLKKQKLMDTWDSCNCSIEELAYILHTYQEPVVFLSGRAEIGPRALGNRSILASPVNMAMKSVLNRVKQRADYRPVAPICLEEYAPEIFTPGTPDPYMVFDHQVNDNWVRKIPAICHLDGSARLQTINEEQNSEIYQLLSAYKRLSGIPLLCNTSANFNGKGFFPDVTSVMKWGKIDIIWSEGKVYAKRDMKFHKDYFQSATISE